MARMFANSPDDKVREAMELHFSIVTGLFEPTPKGPNTDKSYAGQMTFVNARAFHDSFMVAKERGILHPVEISQGIAILRILGWEI